MPIITPPHKKKIINCLSHNSNKKSKRIRGISHGMNFINTKDKNVIKQREEDKEVVVCSCLCVDLSLV